tara:strand:- start:55892 stop:56674 length:783 start_codon:yes stop_codon:yes gene_type:complete
MFIMIKKENYFFSWDLAKDIKLIQAATAKYYHNNANYAPRYAVWFAENENVFSLGIDIKTTLEYVDYQQTENLQDYLLDTLDACYIQTHSLSLPMISISFLSGKVWGLGLAFGLSMDINICDENTTFGVRDIKMNILPSFLSLFVLSRHLSFNSLDTLTSDLCHLTPQKLSKVHLVDYVINGAAYEQINDVIEKVDEYFFSYLSSVKIKKHSNMVTANDLEQFTGLWLTSISNLGKQNREKLEKLIEEQEKVIAHMESLS